MSRIKETVQEMEAARGLEDQREIKLIAITARLSEDDMWRLEFVAKRLGYTKTGFAQAILPDAILEAAEGLGYPLAELQALYLSEKSKKPIEECREMLSQSGFFPASSKEAN